MSDVFYFHRGNSPLLVSIPHDGRELPPDIARNMSGAGLAIPDTDWHVRRLYGFAESTGASVIAANYSRYVVDLNRSSGDEALYDGQVSTGLCPLQTFAGDAIYKEGNEPDGDEIERRIANCWKPYHACIAESLEALRAEYGHAFLWDAHSIPGVVPRLFSGELPALNIGTHDGRSCPAGILRQVRKVADASPWSAVANARFKGGYITRHYGRPRQKVFAMQLETTQRCYMNEATLRYDKALAAKFSQTIQSMLSVYRAESIAAAESTGKPRTPYE